MKSIFVACLCLHHVGAGLAWIPTVPSPSIPSQLFSRPLQDSLFQPDSNPPSHTSRRQWLAGVASAGALLGWESPSKAATVASSASLCDPTVSVWENPRTGRLVYLLGTAHISTSSAELAGQLVRDTHPDAVFVELDLKRLGGSGSMAKRMAAGEQLMTVSDSEDPESKPSRVMVSPVGRTLPTATANIESSSSTAIAATDATTEIVTAPPPPVQEEKKPRGGGFLNNLGAAAVGKGIRGLYSKLGSEGFNPGEEFVVAIKEGQKQGSAIVLGDQDVDVTLRRMSQAFQQTDLNKLLNPDSELEASMREMMPSPAATGGAVSEDEAFRTGMSEFVETMKTKENVKKVMGLMQKEAPALYQVMVSERDAYMAAGLNTLNEFAIITAVMGLAHVDGVETNLTAEGWKRVPIRCAVSEIEMVND